MLVFGRGRTLWEIDLKEGLKINGSIALGIIGSLERGLGHLEAAAGLTAISARLAGTREYEARKGEAAEELRWKERQG